MHILNKEGFIFGLATQGWLLEIFYIILSKIKACQTLKESELQYELFKNLWAFHIVGVMDWEMQWKMQLYSGGQRTSIF